MTQRHRLAVEIVVIVVGYGVYDGSRGLVGSGRAVAVRHAQDIARWEQDLGIGVERSVQHAVSQVPALMDVFDVGYLTLHLGVTVTVLAWLWWTRSLLFPRIRNALLVASGLALTVFVVFPTAPPRMAGIGLADTVKVGHVGLESGALSAFYNPYAAFPSLHLAYASLVGLALLMGARRRWVRVLGAVYPAFVAAEVIATGNHFVLDLAAGLVVATLSWTLATRLDHLGARHPEPAAVPAPVPAVVVGAAVLREG